MLQRIDNKQPDFWVRQGYSPFELSMIALRASSFRTRISAVKEALTMTKKATHTQITKTQIYRSVASSTAIETGVSVQKIEQQLKQNQAQAKAVGLAR